ncbi:DUF6233 domain-containing protein [Streptomyces sp. NPDC004783]
MNRGSRRWCSAREAEVRLSRDGALRTLANGVRACGACRPDSEPGFPE